MGSKGSCISSAVYQKVFDLLEDFYTCQSKTELVEIFFDKTEALIPHETAVCFPVDPVSLTPSTTGHMFKNLSPADEITARYGSYYYALDPMNELLNDSAPVNKAISYTDIMPVRKIMDGEFYCDFLKPLGITYTIGCHISFHSKPGHGVGFGRPYGSADFAERDKKIFDLVAPHFARAIHQRELLENFNEPLVSCGLSPREGEVAALVTQGFGNHEIAERLFITEQTVKDHLRSVYRKAGVKTRSRLIVKLLGSSPSYP